MALNRLDILIVTYCSRDKCETAGLISAVDRYLSPRVRAAHEASRKLGAGFSILSGLHGLLLADQAIAHYDHLLIPELVPEHTRKVADQLQAAKAMMVVFITRSINVDPGSGPYSTVMRQACSRAQVGFEEVVFTQDDPTGDDLVNLVRPLLS